MTYRAAQNLIKRGDEPGLAQCWSTSTAWWWRGFALA